MPSKLYPLPLVLSMRATEKSLVSSSSFFPIRSINTLISYPWAFSNPGCKNNVKEAPAPSPSLQSFPRVPWVGPCLSCTGESTTGHSTPDVALSVQSRDRITCFNALPSAAQEAVGCLSHEGSLLARGHLGDYQEPKVLFSKAAFQPVSMY